MTPLVAIRVLALPLVVSRAPRRPIGRALGAVARLGHLGGLFAPRGVLDSHPMATIRPAPRLCSTHPGSAIIRPSDVLDFWLGDYANHTDPDRTRMRMWFSRDERVDEKARTFIPQIRAAGKAALEGDEWQTREGMIAQLILLDQLSRNAFRGSPEAFAYDERATAVAQQLIATSKDAPHSLPASAALFVVTCLMHSECLELHAACARFAAEHTKVSRSRVIERQLLHDLPEHTNVLRRFGRYPHRNGLHGRQNTLEEEAWLASDECPGWAKSQRPSSA